MASSTSLPAARNYTSHNASRDSFNRRRSYSDQHLPDQNDAYLEPQSKHRRTSSQPIPITDLSFLLNDEDDEDIVVYRPCPPPRTLASPQPVWPTRASTLCLSPCTILASPISIWSTNYPGSPHLLSPISSASSLFLESATQEMSPSFSPIIFAPTCSTSTEPLIFNFLTHGILPPSLSEDLVLQPTPASTHVVMDEANSTSPSSNLYRHNSSYADDDDEEEARFPSCPPGSPARPSLFDLLVTREEDEYQESSESENERELDTDYDFASVSGEGEDTWDFVLEGDELDWI